MSERKTVTLSDVAAQLGVSKMTVSNALSADLSRRRKVSEETRSRVLATIAQLKYRPNATARSLRLRRTNIIGLYSGYQYLSPDSAFIAAIIGGVQRGCDEHRKDLLLHGVFRRQSVDDIVGELADGRIDGLILKAPPGDPLLARLAELPLPVVALAEATPLLPAVTVDDADGSRQTAAYLAAKGHRRVVYLATCRFLASAHRRREAFLEAAAHGMEVCVCPVGAEANSAQLTDAELDWLDAPAAVRPTVAVCWNDPTAYSLITHAYRRGLRVPDDLAVVGFDGVTYSSCPGWHLTTVFAPWSEAARTAVELLVRRMEGETVPQETVLPVTFIPGSTA